MTAGPKGYACHDAYAARRCECGHLQYADETPGGSCRFRPCTDHRAAGTPQPRAATDLPGPDGAAIARPGSREHAGVPAGEPRHDNDYRFEQQGVSGYEL